MNLRFQNAAEASDEVLAAIEDSEDWLSLQEVAELLDIDGEEDYEALNDLQMVLNFMARYGKVQRMKTLGGGMLYKA